MEKIKIKLTETDYVIINKISEIDENGNLDIDYTYDGDLLEDELKRLIEIKVNEVIETSFYGAEND